MGKNNGKFDRYERQDLSGMLDKPTGGKKPFKGNRNNIRKERPAPVVSKIASGICNLFAQQVINYCDFLNGDVDQGTYLDKKKELEHDLFFIKDYNCNVARTEKNEETGEVDTLESYMMYLVDRSVRFDRETHNLIRASMSAVVINPETATPVFFVSAYLNKDLIGNVQVTPFNVETGPDYYNSARWNNRPKKAEVVE